MSLCTIWCPHLLIQGIRLGSYYILINGDAMRIDCDMDFRSRSDHLIRCCGAHVRAPFPTCIQHLCNGKTAARKVLWATPTTSLHQTFLSVKQFTKSQATMMAIASSLRSQRNDKLSRRSKGSVTEEDASENNVFIKKYLDGSSNNGEEPEGSECSLTEASSFGNSTSSLGASLSEFSTGPLIREVPPMRIDKTSKRNRGLYRSRSSRLIRERGIRRSTSGHSLSDANNKSRKSKKKTDELGSTSAHVVSGNTNKHLPSSSSYNKKNQENRPLPSSISPLSTSNTTPHSPPVNRRVQRSYSTQSFLTDRSLNTPPVRKPLKKTKSDDLGGGSAHVTGSATVVSGRRRLESPRKESSSPTGTPPDSPTASPKKKRSDRKLKKQKQKLQQPKLLNEEHTPFVSPQKSPRSKTRLSRAISTRNVAGEARSKGGFLMEPPARPSRAAAAAIMAPGKKSQLVRPTRSVSPPPTPPSASEELQERILRRTKSLQELGERTEETYYTILKEHNDSAHVEREVRETSDYGNPKVVIKLNKDRLSSASKRKTKTAAPPSRASGMMALNHFLNTSDKALQAYDDMLKETNDSARADDRQSAFHSNHKSPKFSDMTI